MPESLFREEAALYRTTDAEGRRKLVSPPGAGLLLLLLVTTLLVVGWFLATNDYARKATVPGYLESQHAIKRVRTSDTGVVEATFVASGDLVETGSPIVRIRSSIPVDETERDKLLSEYRLQLRSVTARQAQLEKQAEVESADIASRVDAARSAIRHGKRVLELETAKETSLNDTYNAAQPLYEQGKLSRIEWNRFRTALLASRQNIENMTSEQSRRQESLRQLGLEQSRSSARIETGRENLGQEASRIRQAISKLQGESRFVIKAPSTGVITNVFAEPGDTLERGTPVASIADVDSPLHVVLLIPTRSAGFVEPEQDVNVLYDAFPYQQFGTYRAHIERVTSHALLPGDERLPVAVREPYFAAIARLDSPTVKAYGNDVPLRAGMTLQADVILDHRTLVDWLLAPLKVMRGRSD
ncbi:MAG: HlyD family efflux transporter periplasmic adaptor subunit [Pseudomonadales bacterium]|nr:HlyD family efflux transporter periplasmic adaptor subunit [Pseudomonadales bacterium]